MPRIKTTIRLLIACIIAGTCLLLIDRHNEKQSLRRVNSSKLYPNHFDEINRVVLSPAGEAKREFHLDADGWKIVSPVSSPASESSIQKMIDAFEAAPLYDLLSREEIDLRKLNDSHFGLDTPCGILEIYGPRTSTTIKIGNSTIMTNEVFARIDNESDILVTTPELTEYFKKPLEDFADRRLLKANVRDTEILLIEQPGLPSLRVQRAKDNLSWQITSPSQGQADWTEIGNYLELLHTARIKTFPYGQEYKNPIGEPLLTLKLFNSNTPFPATITIDGQIPDEPDTYLAHNDSGTEVTIDGDIVRKLAITDNDIRDKRILPSGPTLNVTFFSITPASGPSISLDKTIKNDWSVVSPIKANADQENVSGLVNSILKTTAQNYIPTERLKNYNASAITGPIITIRTPSTTNRLSCTLLVRSAAQTNAAIIVDEAQFAAILPASKLANLFDIIQEPHKLVGKTITAIATNDLRTIAVTKQGLPTEKFLKHGNSDWELSEDMATNLVINANGLKTLVDTISNLTAEEVVAIIGSDVNEAHYQLTSPRLEIKLDYQDETIPSTVIAFGATTPQGGTYATIRGEGIVFEISSEAFENLFQNLTEIGTAPGTPQNDLQNEPKTTP